MIVHETGSHLQHALAVGTVCTELLRHRARASPDEPLLYFDDDRWTCAECWSGSAAAARYFRNASERPSGASLRIAIFLDNRPEAVFAWFGAQLADAVPVMLNRGHRGPILAGQLQESLADVLVTDAVGLDRVAEAGALAGLRVIVCDDDRVPPDAGTHSVTPWPKIPGDAHPPASAAATHRPRPGDLATIMFTSGTTGRSKAVRIPQSMIARGAARLADAFGFREGDVYHGWLPLYHIGGLLHTLMSMVVCGGAVALIRKFSLSRFWDEVRRYECTVFAGLGSTINLLWRTPPTAADSSNTLRVGLGAMCPAEILRDFEQRFGVLLLDSYGMTECEPVSLPPGPAPLPPGSCGKANPDFEVAIVDEQDVERAPNLPGEIVVRPRIPHQVMQGYENDPAATVRAWRNLWMHTGDLGRIDAEGYLYVEGRLKDMIRRRGENISGWEIENVLRSHPSIEDCAALGIPIEAGEEEIKVAVVPAGGSKLDIDELYRICTATLSTFMVPRYLEIRDTLPLNGIGKVDRKALQQPGTGTADMSRKRSGPRRPDDPG